MQILESQYSHVHNVKVCMIAICRAWNHSTVMYTKIAGAHAGVLAIY